MTPKRIAFNTQGCKLNFSETSSISRQFGIDSYLQVDFSEKADIYVINSCSVTSNAEKRCKALIRQAMRRNPEASVAVVGCYSQIKPEELIAIPGVALVLGNADKFNLFEHIKQLEAEKYANPSTYAPTPQSTLTAENEEKPMDMPHKEGDKPPYKPPNRARQSLADEPKIKDPSQNSRLTSKGFGLSNPNNLLTDKLFYPSWSLDDRTRSFFKIQDGCDYYCSYCTIPLARGRSRSDTIANTIKTARQIARSNAKEMVLSGVNIGDFGKLHQESFYDLLKELVTLKGIERIRISSVEPDLLHNKIIELVAGSPILMPHFHIPLQSGSDIILKAMGRRYNTRLFADRIDSIRRHMPHACIAVDLIVGFPGETDALFKESFNFLQQADISYIHVFTYSERDNTRAIQLTNHIPSETRQHRSQQMHILSEKMKHSFYRSNQGRDEKILWENDQKEDYIFGFTENYIKAKTKHKPVLINTIQPVRLNNLTDDGVYLID